MLSNPMHHQVAILSSAQALFQAVELNERRGQSLA